MSLIFTSGSWKQTSSMKRLSLNCLLQDYLHLAQKQLVLAIVRNRILDWIHQCSEAAKQFICSYKTKYQKRGLKKKVGVGLIYRLSSFYDVKISFLVILEAYTLRGVYMKNWHCRFLECCTLLNDGRLLHIFRGREETGTLGYSSW